MISAGKAYNSQFRQYSSVSRVDSSGDPSCRRVSLWISFHKWLSRHLLILQACYVRWHRAGNCKIMMNSRFNWKCTTYYIQRKFNEKLSLQWLQTCSCHWQRKCRAPKSSRQNHRSALLCRVTRPHRRSCWCTRPLLCCPSIMNANWMLISRPSSTDWDTSWLYNPENWRETQHFGRLANNKRISSECNFTILTSDIESKLAAMCVRRIFIRFVWLFSSNMLLFTHQQSSPCRSTKRLLGECDVLCRICVCFDVIK